MNKRPEFLQFLHTEWVNQQLEQMTLAEKVAQLLHVATWSNRDESHYQSIESLIGKYGIGGLTFFQGDPISQAKLTNRYQAVSKIPLMISIDAEWGLAMRLNDTVRFPYQMALGAIQDNTLIYQMGREIGRQCRRLGIHINFAPDVDINTHPDNPVIGFRSFGSDKEAVVEKAKAYMEGLQEETVLAVAKHFPGHGDTHSDSHFTLPVLTHSRERLEEIELYPYKKLIPEGIGGIMTAHLHVPAIDPEPDSAASLSPRITRELLIDHMGFEGLIITDALDMKGVAAFREADEVNLMAFLAGNDIMLFCTDVKGSIEKIIQQVDAGAVSKIEINRRCRKILAAKYWLGLSHFEPILLSGLDGYLNNAHSEQLNQRLAAESMTFYSPNASATPVFVQPGEKTASLAIFAQKEQSANQLIHHRFQRTREAAKNDPAPLFQRILSQTDIETYTLGHTFEEEEIAKINTQMAEYDHVVVSLHDMQIKAVEGFGITENIVKLVDNLSTSTQISFVLFGSAYALRKFQSLNHMRSILVAYQETAFTETAAADVLKGNLIAKGKLPILL
ncbi:MAG: glycoside hydrolase family 3 N-terminal domain-containing protein [Bacteroidia bacterium]